MANHGVYVSEQATSVSTPVVADSGVPFVVAAAPVQSAATPAAAGVPVLCTSWAEAVEKLGYSDDWGELSPLRVHVLPLPAVRLPARHHVQCP